MAKVSETEKAKRKVVKTIAKLAAVGEKLGALDPEDKKFPAVYARLHLLHAEFGDDFYALQEVGDFADDGTHAGTA
jgi:hypothetical protein